MTPDLEPLLDAIDHVREHDPRFRREAYLFVVAALGEAVRNLPAERSADPALRHLSGREVLTATVALARSEFGPLARVVFGEWGVTEGRHVGEIVFQLVSAGQLSARPEDRLDDFLGGPRLLAALAEPAPAAARGSHQD